MNKFLLPALGFVAAMGSANIASADALTCSLRYEVKGGGLQIAVGYYRLTGFGQIRCRDIHGQRYIRDVNVSIGRHPIAPRVGIGYFHLYGASSSFGFNGSIDDLYGDYLMADAQASVGLGAGAQFAVQNPVNGLRLNLGITASHGLGAEAGLSLITIEPRTEEKEF